jgi:nicotinate-nucleotide adenylyltransferase
MDQNGTEKNMEQASGSSRPDQLKKIGVFGGSFDPIHIGHLAIAQEARWQFELDVVLFMVTAHPPHKKEPEAPVEHRLRMVESAIEDEPYFEPSRIEIERGGDSYTAETLRQLRKMYPQASLYLIVGSDSAIDFSTWKNPEEVIEMANVVIASRPGFDLSLMEPRLKGKADISRFPALELSSTTIRERLRSGRPIRFLVPEVVERYIREHGLYSG